MNVQRAAILVMFVALLAIPLVFKRQGAAASQGDIGGARLPLIIITPHNEQIRFEFGRAFDAWHRKRYGAGVQIHWNVPGGTTEIRKMLEAQYQAALRDGRPVGGAADLVFGGGSYEHDQFKRQQSVTVEGAKREASISQPAGFDEAWLQRTYGENRIGDTHLYDPDQYWFGTALSGFGIVYNRDALRRLDVPEPRQWTDLTAGTLYESVALVNPAQSGSITTAFEAILKQRGWVDGWRILRRAAANARYFSGSSLKPPIDVSQGDAAVGICIDFYGRFQSQVLVDAGDPDRVGYVDPPGESTIDPDPVSMLNGAPHADIARHFIEFCLSEPGQALWQFRIGGGTADIPGPQQFELRRLPILRSMYANHMSRMIDHVNPFDLAQAARYPDSNFRAFIAPLFAAMAMDSHDELSTAWKAIIDHPAYPRGSDAPAIVTADDVADPTLREMLAAFDELPVVFGPDGNSYPMADPASLPTVRNGWLKGQWIDAGLWNPQVSPADALRREWGRYFRGRYARVVEVAAGRLMARKGGQP